MHLKSLVTFYIVSEDGQKTLAFDAITDTDFNFSFDINEDKAINFIVTNMNLTEFYIEHDNCGTKGDQDNIKQNFNSMMEVLQNTINVLLPLLNLRLPTFETFDYDISFRLQRRCVGSCGED